MPQIGFTGTSPYKKHRKVPVRLPLRSNLAPLVTSTYLDLANLNSGCWTCLPQVAHMTLNPSIERETLSAPTLHTPQKFWKFIAPSKFSNTLTSESRYFTAPIRPRVKTDKMDKMT